MKKLRWLVALMLLASPAWATSPFQPLTPQTTAAAASQVLVGRNLVTSAVTWNAATTARYFFVFDATALPSNGAVAGCTASHVTGCWLWCGYMPTSQSAPGLFTWDETTHPAGAALFGLVLGVSTGAGCGTFTADGNNDFFSTQAY